MALLTNYLITARMRRIEPFVHGDVLDLGCGSAGALERFGDRITSYCGVEQSEDAVASLRKKYPKAAFVAKNLDEDRLDFGKRFDSILMIALIEHLFNQKRVMEQMAAALKPNGMIVVTTPTPFGNDVIHRLGAAVGLFSKEAVEDHIVIYNRLRMNLIAKETGLKVASYYTFQFGCNQLATLAKD